MTLSNNEVTLCYIYCNKQIITKYYALDVIFFIMVVNQGDIKNLLGKDCEMKKVMK